MADTAVDTETEQDKRHLGSMSLLQHLEELRRRIIFSAASVAVCFGIGWYFAERIYEKMAEPARQALRANHWPDKLTYLNPTDPFNNSIKIAFITAIFISSPIILYQLWMFISPGLYRNEKRFVLPFLFLSVGLFVSGGYFGYRVVYPVALEFLIGYGGPNLQPVITITEYTSLFLTVILGLAVIFELPIVLGFLALMGVVDARFLFRHIRGAVFLFFVVAAILTPTTDIMNMTIYAAPMIVLYILSIGIAWLVH